MLGVLYPLIFDYLYDERISVGPPYYNTIFAPLTFLAAIFLVFSVGSLWQRTSKLLNFKSFLSMSILFAAAASICISYIYQEYQWWFIGGIFSGFLILIRYFFLIADSFMKKNYFNKSSATAHIGFGVLILATALNASLSYEKIINIKPGEIYKDSDYEFYLIDFENYLPT